MYLKNQQTIVAHEDDALNAYLAEYDERMNEEEELICGYCREQLAPTDKQGTCKSCADFLRGKA